jgi:outer membrane putative beta-barrel porin/alpha-amylase
MKRSMLRVLRHSVLTCVLGLGLLVARPAAGQELEPRAYSVSPSGTNFIVISYGRSFGDLAFDPALPIEDASATINAVSAGYFRSINFLGRSANVTLVTPYSWGTLEGTIAGEFQSVRRSGLRDPLVRFAVNLYGAPSMGPKEFATYRPRTIVGASLAIVAPFGQYDPAKLINLGANRWAFKPEIGVSRVIGRVSLDFYGGVWLFTDNNNFRGRTREQALIGSGQFHLSYTVKPRMWVAFDANLYAGGRTRVNGVPGSDLQRNSRLGGTFSLPLGRQQSVKVSYSRGAITTVGADFQAIGVAYQYLW